MSKIPLQNGLSLLEVLVWRSKSQVMVSPIDWQTLLNTLGIEPPKVTNVTQDVGDDSAQEAGEQSTLLDDMAQMPADEHYDYFVKFLQKRLMLMLKLKEEPAENKALGELGLDSLLAMELRNTVKSLTKVNMPPTALFDYPTLTELATYLLGEMNLGSGTAQKKKKQVSDVMKLVKLQQGTQDDTAVFCLPGAGGNLFTQYSALAKCLGTKHTVFEFVVGNHVLPSVEEMAAVCVEEIQQAVKDGTSISLVGWSYGGVVAHEVGKQIQKLGEGKKYNFKAIALIDWMESARFTEKFNVSVAALGSLVRSIEVMSDNYNLHSELSGMLPADFYQWEFDGQARWVIDEMASRGLFDNEQKSVLLEKVGAFQEAVESLQHYRAEPFPDPKSPTVLAFPCSLEGLDDVDPFNWSTFQPAAQVTTLQCSHWACLKNPHIDTVAKSLGDVL
eukprot:TRINITY_DN67571_c6_g1_i2.p1 TRINITY_DN67571_c6_g1~~TRINITY_DN67571_c6_g1_i2.p1  ORF type:complete len:473 (+),score=65.16 TRINITY_DN67571_c6_g1_i2:86-1420(+)